MSETLPPQVATDTDEIVLVPSATRGMRREDIDLASLKLPFADTPPPPNFTCLVGATGRIACHGRRGHRAHTHYQP